MNIEEYLPTWLQRLEKESAAVEQRRRAAREAAERMARVLVTEFAAERVYLFGSLWGLKIVAPTRISTWSWPVSIRLATSKPTAPL